MTTDEEPTMNEPEASRLLTEQETAARLGVTIHALRKWRARRIGPVYVKLTRSVASGVRYDPADLDAWIESRKQRPGTRS